MSKVDLKVHKINIVTFLFFVFLRGGGGDVVMYPAKKKLYCLLSSLCLDTPILQRFKYNSEIPAYDLLLCIFKTYEIRWTNSKVSKS